MAELPPSGSDDNKIEGYSRAEDVLAAFEHYLNPKFLQRVLETVPVHNLTDEPLSVSQTSTSSDQSSFRDHSISSPRARSRSPRRSPPAPESIQSSVPMWLSFVRPHENYRSLPLRQRELHSECSSSSSSQHTPTEAAGLADSARGDTKTQDKLTAERPARLSRSPAISPSASVIRSSGLSDAIESSIDQSSAAI